MDILSIIEFLFPIVLMLLVLSFAGLIILISIYATKQGIKRKRKRKKHRVSRHSNLTPVNEKQKTTLPNNYQRSDYHDYGFTDVEIEFWGLDQPDAPPPEIAGWVIFDMADGNLDGSFDLFG